MFCQFSICSSVSPDFSSAVWRSSCSAARMIWKKNHRSCTVTDRAYDHWIPQWDLSEHVKMIQNVELKSNSFKLCQYISIYDSIIFYMSITFEFLILSYNIPIGLPGQLPIFQALIWEAKEAGKRLRSITPPGSEKMVTAVTGNREPQEDRQLKYSNIM